MGPLRPLPPHPGQMHRLPPRQLLQMPPRPQRHPLHPRPNRPLRRLRNPRRYLLHPPPRRHPPPTRHPPHPPPPKFQILPIQRSLAFADVSTSISAPLLDQLHFSTFGTQLWIIG